MTLLPVIVYLDTQDYSRFGDVLRGRASAEISSVFGRLKELRRTGKAMFVYSMPIVSELLQFDAAFEETCVAKAKAIEELCRGAALVYPGRLIEAQAAEFALARGIITECKVLDCIRSDNEWFPKISGTLTSFKSNLRNKFQETIQSFGPLNRKARRTLKKTSGDATIVEAARAAIPEISAKYQLPPSAIEASIIALMADRISTDEASLRLFGTIAKPTSFIHVYFKAYEGDTTSIPSWMRSAGETLQSAFVRLRERMEPYLDDPLVVEHFRELMGETVQRMGSAVLRLIDVDERELGITEQARERVMNELDVGTAIPACELAGALLFGYLEQIIGARGKPAKIEHSFGGDLVHALYIDVVDIWRGDRRFTELVKQKLPSRRSKLQPSLQSLPEHIERLYDERASS